MRFCGAFHRSALRRARAVCELGCSVQKFDETTEVGAGGEGPSRVKLRRTQCEHIFSALLSNADIHRGECDVLEGPPSDVDQLFDYFLRKRGN